MRFFETVGFKPKWDQQKKPQKTSGEIQRRGIMGIVEK